VKTIPVDQRTFEAQIAELIRTNKLPTPDQVRAAITETKAKYVLMRPSDFQNRLRIHALRRAAEKIQREEFHKIIYGTRVKQIAAPIPIQLRFQFAAEGN
jgi:hypothetical protein